LVDQLQIDPVRAIEALVAEPAAGAHPHRTQPRQPARLAHHTRAARAMAGPPRRAHRRPTTRQGHKNPRPTQTPRRLTGPARTSHPARSRSQPARKRAPVTAKSAPRHTKSASAESSTTRATPETTKLPAGSAPAGSLGKPKR
jgi:hypothetical protein